MQHAPMTSKLLDCKCSEIGVWAAWSTCTASCDGGVMTRLIATTFLKFRFS